MRVLFKKIDFLSSLTKINFVTSIEEYAFYKCSSLKQVLLENPSSVTIIGDNSFEKFSSLTQITFPSSLLLIQNLLLVDVRL